jgi:hypothetical protein
MQVECQLMEDLSIQFDGLVGFPDVFPTIFATEPAKKCRFHIQKGINRPISSKPQVKVSSLERSSSAS